MQISSRTLSKDKERLKKESGSDRCRWAGRRLIEFSPIGQMPFVNELRALAIESDRPCMKHMAILHENGWLDQISAIQEGFVSAKRLLESRFIQYTSFLLQPPWSLVALLEYLLPPKNPGEMTNAIARSRARALDVLRSYDTNSLEDVGDVGIKFLQTTHRSALERWGHGLDFFMNQNLYRDLVSWGSSLLVMQRLEAKHHLVHAAWWHDY